MYWYKDKYYPRDFKTKREEFLYKLTKTGVITTPHLERLIKKFPSHKYINEMKQELIKRRNNASKI